jgi:acyl dehydratase
MRTIRGIEELAAAEGGELGVSDWHKVTQERIDAFAAATGDTYWIHTDPERAKAGPLGSTVAHGLYTLSLGPRFMYSIVAFEGFSTTLNYGYDKVRFIAPVPVDARVRMRPRLTGVKRVTGGAHAALVQTFEIEGGDKPACVAESILRFVD